MKKICQRLLRTLQPIELDISRDVVDLDKPGGISSAVYSGKAVFETATEELRLGFYPPGPRVIRIEEQGKFCFFEGSFCLSLKAEVDCLYGDGF